MQLTETLEIDAPISFVFAACSDFERFERRATQRGATIARTDTLNAPGAGMTWNARFRMRGRDRSMGLELVTYKPDEVLALRSVVSGLDGIGIMDFAATGPESTRLGAAIDVSAQTLAARLVLQTLKLGRSRLKQKLRQRLVGLGARIEAEYRAGSQSR